MLNVVTLFGVPIYRLEIEVENVDSLKEKYPNQLRGKNIDDVIERLCQPRLATTKGLFVSEDLFKYFPYAVRSKKKVIVDINSGENPEVVLEVLKNVPSLRPSLKVRDNERVYSLRDVSQEYDQRHLSVFKSDF